VAGADDVVHLRPAGGVPSPATGEVSGTDRPFAPSESTRSPTERALVLGVAMTLFLRFRVLAVVVLALSLLGSPVASADPQTWGNCGPAFPPDKVARTFQLGPVVIGPPPGPATLYCGTPGQGERHIEANHGKEWEYFGSVVGEVGNWRYAADWAIEQVLARPMPGYPIFDASNNSWSYTAPIEIRDHANQVRDVWYPIVAIAGQDGKVLTAIPRHRAP
jgi:hypothetical protein